MKSEFESREVFECIFGDEGEIDLSKDETGEYSFQPSRFAYSFFLVAWQYRQTEVDELQRRNKMLIDSIKEQGQKLVYQNEVIETQAEKLLCLRDEKAELQKRVDAAKYYMKNIFSGDAEVDQCHLGDLLDILDGKIVDELEQALKGGSDESN